MDVCWFGKNQVSFELSPYQAQIIAEVDALLSGLPDGAVDASRSGVSIACQQHAPVPGQPDARTICYTVVPTAPDAGMFELTIGAVSPITSVGSGDEFYWQINCTCGEFSTPLLTSVIPLCEAVIAGNLSESFHYRGSRLLSNCSRLTVVGSDRPLENCWFHPWTYPMLWLGRVREELLQYTAWA